MIQVHDVQRAVGTICRVHRAKTLVGRGQKLDFFVGRVWVGVMLRLKVEARILDAEVGQGIR